MVNNNDGGIPYWLFLKFEINQRVILVNSRQRRKQAAEKHNALLIENEAYAEDRMRDPAKYGIETARDVIEKSRRFNSVLAVATLSIL